MLPPLPLICLIGVICVTGRFRQGPAIDINRIGGYSTHMTASQILILIAGIAAIAWVNWYFFVAPRRQSAQAVASAGATQEALIVVHGGYEPATIRVRSGMPVRLTFDRQETSSCSEEIVFPDFNIRRFLPAYERTTIELPAPSPGEHPFMCGMSMMHGRLIAE